MNKFTIIPSTLKYESAPNSDQELSISLESQTKELTEFDRSQTISLGEVFYDERQASTIFRPTFKINYLYNNTYTGTTQYLPFQYNLYYINNAESKSSGIWKGFPQYYEFDFYRPNINDNHIDYKSVSAYTYNWTYYLSYPYENDDNKNVFCTLNETTFNWRVSNGIPFVIKNSTDNGSRIISFECVAPHGLSTGEYVELSFSYANQKYFQVFSLGNNKKDSDKYVFNIINIGYTGNTFNNNVKGLFKRVINPDNLTETKSKYYIKKHKILTNVEDINIVKSGFELNAFKENTKLELSSITPNNVTRLSKLNSSNTYTITSAKDLNISGLLDNQKRPITELFLTIINRGYSGYFNKPNNNIGLKQGWEFNITTDSNVWWDDNNTLSNTNIQTSSYTKTNGVTKTFYYNNNLNQNDLIDGDFCEWNDYEQKERVISKYYHKIRFNQNVFQTTENLTTNSPGYYYNPHNSVTIRVFSNYIETADVNQVDNIPNYSFFSSSDQQFRWRDLYDYGFVDDLGNGVDYPFFNTAHYPFENVIFRLIPEGSNVNNFILGVDTPVKILIDDCE
jgi:hypothetical protein